MMHYKLGDFLLRQKESTLVQDGNLYKRAKIRINHNGISVRDEVDGSAIRTKKQFLIHAGQFLLSKIDARNGAFGIVPEELENGIITGNFWTFDVDQTKVLIDYLKAFTETNVFADICIRASSGTTNRKYLDEKKFLNIEIDVPSISEQKSIIKLFHKKKYLFNQIQTKTIEQESSISKLKQAILQEAVQGKLTERWRMNHPDVGSVSKLLKGLKEEKVRLIKDKKIKKSNVLPPINEEEIPYDLPAGWIWCRWVDLLGFVKYPMKRGPFGSALRKADFVSEGIRVFEQYNPINDDPHWVRYYITEKKYEKLKAFTTDAGDLLISCSGATLGRITELPIGVEPGIINQALLKLSLNKLLIENSYFIKLFRSEHIQSRIWKKALGSAIPNMVGVSELKQMLIPLPPLEEQKAIVQKINALRVLYDDLELELESNKKQSDKLFQSALGDIFQVANS